MNEHQIGDLVYFKNRVDNRNEDCLGMIVKRHDEHKELYYIAWFDDDDDSATGSLAYSEDTIRHFKRNLKLLLEGFE